ncbi:hypothetical protein [Glaciibacter superstes]|uniref:hypothetical protein n=1 Tax=Glaciibacter superstes TaxID=501023 RepID=UPI0003B5B8F8|nr:hypothetical protein [Glaciibacter superstes]
MGILTDQLRQAATTVAASVSVTGGVALNADQVHRLARRLRDELDQDGILARAKSQHDARYFKVWRRPDGMRGTQSRERRQPVPRKTRELARFPCAS